LHFLRFHITLLLLSIGMIYGTAFAQNISIDTETSRLWIEGSSNVNRFQCRAARYTTDVEPPTKDTTAQVEVDVAVEGFDCGKRRMNRDLYETLLSNRHPFISFEYKSTESMNFSKETDTYILIVNGTLSVAGFTNDIRFPLTAKVIENGRMRATGQVALKMTNYNVEPPSALLGLVRVNDELTVHFEIFASMNTSELQQNGQN